MRCDEVRKIAPLFLYGELSFDGEEQFEQHLEGCPDCRRFLEREKALQSCLDEVESDLPAGLLGTCRRDLRASLENSSGHPGHWERWREAFAIRWIPLPSFAQPAGAIALVLFGFFAARFYFGSISPGSSDAQHAALTAPLSTRIRYLEPDGAGHVQIVVDETRQRVLTGDADDESIRRLLLTAAQDPRNPGLRVESVDLLKNHMESAEVRRALLTALQHDPNAGVRLKALDGLKQFAADPETRQVLMHVLLADKNPGVRTQVIDLLVRQKNEKMVGVFQELMHKEQNGYVRLRCERALREMNASLGTF